MRNPAVIAVVAAVAGLLVGLSGTAGAQPAARQAAETVSVPSYCTSKVTVVRQYTVNVDPGDDSFRSGVAGHGDHLNCITIYAGNYAKTLQFDPTTGGWLIPETGINGIYFDCGPKYEPPFRWSMSGLPFNDCAEAYALATKTPDGGLQITWPQYNGQPMYPATTP